MNNVLTRVICLVAVSLGPASLQAAVPGEIRWSELAALVVGHQVSIPLPGGVVVAGEALSVRDDSLMLDIARTSDRKRYANGQTPIPRALITELRLVERRGAGGRILGTAVGALAGIVAGAEIAAHGTQREAAAVSTFSATAIACTVGGYFVGRSVDRHSRLLRIAQSGVE
jgi:hypothetical protein